MSFSLKKLFGFLFSVEPEDRAKIFFLALAFFFITFSNTLLKELKDSVFSAIVGKDYVPFAKILGMFFLIPALFIYSKLVDYLRRYQLLTFYTSLYGIVTLIFIYFLGHPTIGLSNTDSGPYRIFGWVFYFFFEGYTPFIVSVFWAFANSINSPNSARSNYSLIIASSKMGGMLSAGLAWLFLTMQEMFEVTSFSDALNHQILALFLSIGLLFVPFVIRKLMKVVPGYQLHGYEAVYKFEKKVAKKGKSKTGIFAGLKILIRQPYVFGIFLILLFYEVINVIISYERLGIAKSSSNSISGFSAVLYKQVFFVHLIGFFIAIFGTRALLQRLGVRFSLLFVPIFSGLLLYYFLFNQTEFTFIFIFVILRSINYAISYPLREGLYIPTTKEAKFKAKSWIDAFGGKMAKSSGSVFNIVASAVGGSYTVVHAVFFGVVIFLWLIVAWVMGKKYDYAIKNNEVIGFTEDEEEE
jgi:AAA family ATP:ADP antiporter